MFDGDTLVGLIDFEEVCQGPALLDVAMAIAGCCYNEKNCLMWDVTQDLLTAYHSCLPLTEIDKQLFVDYLIYSLISVAFWRFRQFRVRRPDPERADVYKHMTDRIDRIDHTQWKALLDSLH